MGKIAIVDPASYALTYDFYYIKSLSNHYKIDFYCSKTSFNYEYVDKIRKLPNVDVYEFHVSDFPPVLGVFSLFFMYLRLLLCYRKYTSINFQWSVLKVVDFFVLFIIRNKLVFTFHNSVPHNSQRKTTYFNKVISFISKRNLFVSDYTRCDFECNYTGVSIAKNFTLQHGIMPLFQQEDYDHTCRENPRRFYETNYGFTPKIIFWGNVKPYKGLDFLVDSLPTLKEKGIELEVYGKYDSNMLYLHDKLNSYGALSINEYLPLPKVQEILSQDNSLIILPYKKATQSGIMYNCLALERPFICSDTGEPAYFLQQLGLGKLVFEYGNISSLLSSIFFFVENEKYIKECISKAKEKYSWQYEPITLKNIFEIE